MPLFEHRYVRTWPTSINPLHRQRHRTRCLYLRDNRTHLSSLPHHLQLHYQNHQNASPSTMPLSKLRSVRIWQNWIGSSHCRCQRRRRTYHRDNRTPLLLLPHPPPPHRTRQPNTSPSTSPIIHSVPKIWKTWTNILHWTRCGYCHRRRHNNLLTTTRTRPQSHMQP